MRLNAHRRGYTKDWAAARERFLREHPLCMCDECKAGELRATPATVVDHILPHRGDMQLFWDESNWQALSKQHHDRKTAREVNERKRENIVTYTLP